MRLSGGEGRGGQGRFVRPGDGDKRHGHCSIIDTPPAQTNFAELALVGAAVAAAAAPAKIAPYPRGPSAACRTKIETE